MTPFPVGTRGLDQWDTPVRVVRACEVKGVKGLIYRYWVINEENGRPGSGPLRLLDIGQFTSTEDEVSKVKPVSEYRMQMMPECEAVTKKWGQR